MSKSVLLMFSSKGFIVSGLTLSSLIHSEFIFVYAVTGCSNFTLLHVAAQFFQLQLWKGLSFLHCAFAISPFSPFLLCHRLDVLYFCGVYPAPLAYISTIAPMPYYLDYLITIALWYSLNSGNLIPPALLFFLKIA